MAQPHSGSPKLLLFAFLFMTFTAGVILTAASRNTEDRSRATGFTYQPTPFVVTTPVTSACPGGQMLNNTCYSNAEYMRYRALHCNRYNVNECKGLPAVQLTADEQKFVNESLPKCNPVLTYMQALCKP